MSTNDDLRAMMEAEGASKPEVSAEDQLLKIRKLAAEQRMIIDEIEKLEATLVKRKLALKRNMEVDLPDAMTDANLSSLTLQDGSVLKIEESVKAGLTKENRPLGIEWLRERGHGDIVKAKLGLAFAKGQDKLLKKLLSILRGFPQFKDKVVFTLEETVDQGGKYNGTLGKFVREHLDRRARLLKTADELLTPADREFLADPLPEGLFGVYRVRAAVVEVPGENGKKKRDKNDDPLGDE